MRPGHPCLFRVQAVFHEMVLEHYHGPEELVRKVLVVRLASRCHRVDQGRMAQTLARWSSINIGEGSCRNAVQVAQFVGQVARRKFLKTVEGVQVYFTPQEDVNVA